MPQEHFGPGGLGLGESMIDMSDRDAVAGLFARITREAGAIVLSLYQNGCAIRAKADESPVSEADEKAEELILARLAELFPGVPVVAEESSARSGAPACGDRFILVDPLDGTREFVTRNGEFTVNIALIEKGVPVAGAVFAPVSGELWWGGRSAFCARTRDGEDVTPFPRPIVTRAAPQGGLVALASRSHGDRETEAFLARLPVASLVTAGSSLKFCRIAEGLADVYPRFTRTMEWDIAAGHAVLAAAGGVVRSPEGAPFLYGKAAQGYANSSFVAWGDPAAAERFR